MTQMGDSYDLTLAAATLRSNSSDVHVLLKALCDELSDAVGERLRVQRGSGRFRKSDTITSVQITMGNDAFEATVDGSTVRCTIGRVSGGIRIRSESVPMDEWIVRLLGALQAEAAHSDAARQALENIVIGGIS
jgi:hypothetical protein